MSASLNKSAAKDSKSLFGAILFKYFPYWPLFIFCVIACLFAAWFYLRTTAPQYEITASIMLKEEKETRNEDVINSFNQVEGKKVVDNEIEILKSSALMSNVVKNLGLYASFYEKDDMIPKSAYTTSPIMVEAARPEELTPVEEVEFSYNEKDSLVSIAGNQYPLNKMVSTPWGDLRFRLNEHRRGKATKPLYFALNSVRNVAAGLQGSFRTTAPSKLTTVIVLKIKDTDPRRGEDILNELIAEYNIANLKEKNRLASSASDFIRGRLEEVKKELDDIEKKAQSFKASRGAVDISTQGQLYLKNITENDQKLADVNNQLSVLQDVEAYVKAKEGAAEGGVLPVGIKDPSISTLVSKLYDEELNYEKLRKTTGENSPVLIAVRDRINKMKPGILEGINNQRSSLETTRNNLQATNGSYMSQLQGIPQVERQLIDISRQQAIKSDLYAYLEQKMTESDLTLRANLLDTRIVDRAQSTTDPVSPKGKLIYLVSFIFALAIPAGLISLKEMLNRKVMYRHEIEGLTNAPIIGEISLEKSKDPLVIQEGKRTFIAEQFRRMRTSIGYVGGSSGKKRILVTSTIPGEGKSFIALNLAQSIALTGKKVVLLELDLANPSLSAKLNAHYETGASDYLQGEVEPEEVIRRTAVNDNLFFLPAGTLPENPSELLMSERTKELLKYLDDVFDVVVIDSAPASMLSDAYVLSPQCDLTLYVVKHKYTPKTFLERLDEDNSGNQLQNMRIVFNGIRSRGFTRNGYGYGYGYGYIHNTTYGKTKKKYQSKA
ncbi:MAG: GumC family protein [Chitinophagaceae bacterium]